MLKPKKCPFCGNKNIEGPSRILNPIFNPWRVWCSNEYCGAAGPAGDTKKEAIVHWNQAAR